jgi:regulatory protein
MAAARNSGKLSGEALWNFALRMLGDRAHSAAELKRKLIRRAEAPSDVTSVMTRLGEYGMIDDRKFSESFASARLANQGYGRFRVLRDLRSKQVPAGVADQAVADVFAGSDEKQLARDYLERKYRGKDLPTLLKEEKHFASAYRRLRLAGFSAHASLAVLKSYHNRAEEFEPGEEDERDPSIDTL